MTADKTYDLVKEACIATYGKPRTAFAIGHELKRRKVAHKFVRFAAGSNVLEPVLLTDKVILVRLHKDRHGNKRNEACALCYVL